MLDQHRPASSLNAAAAEWLVGFSLDTVPAEVVENTRLRILDVIGVMIASSRLDLVSAARQATIEADGAGGNAFALLDDQPTSPANAAFLNGVMSAMLEFDDTHLATNIHPTGVVLSATLQECMRRGLSGTSLIESVLAGSELLCRLGMVSPVRMHEVGFHPSAVYGIFGAVYGLAHLRRLPAEKIIHAIGTAGSLSSGSIASFEDGTSTKTLHVGFAAASAVRAIALAHAGISGPSPVFDGKFGWFKSHVQSGVEFRYPAMTHELGERWEVLDIASKAYPCAYTLMPFIAAAIALRDQHGVRTEDIEAIECEIMPRSFATVCEPVADKRRPRSTWHGRISLQHTVAEALVLGRMDKNAYAPENLANPAINALADKVTYKADMVAAADISRSRARVSLRLTDGREVVHEITDMPGTRRNPISREDYIRKFSANIEGVISNDRGEQLVESLLQLERVADIGALFATLRR